MTYPTKYNMTFKEWLQLKEEYKKNQDQSRRLQVGKKDKNPDWAARPEILSMKKT